MPFSLPRTGRLLMCREPVCGRFGIHRLMAMLSTGGLKVGWNGSEEITVVTFNRRRTLCKILHADEWGVDCTTRILSSGTFKVMLETGSLPEAMTRETLEALLNGQNKEALELARPPSRLAG